MVYMMTDFISELIKSRYPDSNFPFYPELIEGYSQKEVKEIEDLYNLEIHGQFRQFLLQMGKCSGGLLWGDEFVIYNPSYHKNGFETSQADYEEHDDFMVAANGINPIESKLILLSVENETYNYFLLTKNKDDYIWLYDEGSSPSRFINTQMTLLNYLKKYIEYTTKYKSQYSPSLDVVKQFSSGRLL